MLQAAEVKLDWGGKTWNLRVNQRAFYTMQKAMGSEGVSHLGVINAFVEDWNAYVHDPKGFSPLGFEKPESTYVMLWGLTATDRVQNNRQFDFHQSDEDMAFKVPGDFLDTLPADLLPLQTAIFDLLRSSGHVSLKKKEPPAGRSAPGVAGASHLPAPDTSQDSTSP